EDVRERTHAGAEIAADLREDGASGRIILVGEPDEPVRVGRRPERLACGGRRSEPRHIRLEVAATGAGSLARPPVVDDHHMPELDTGSGRTAEGPPVGDHAATEPGSDREHPEVLHTPTGPGAP